MFRRPFGEQLAEIHDRDRLAETHHRLHVVLDQHDGDALLVAQAPHERPHSSGFLGVHPRERLIQHHELWVGGKCHGHAERALVAMGQLGGEFFRLLVEAEEGEDAASLFVCNLFRRAVAPENAAGDACLGAAVAAKADIVEHAQLVKQDRALKRSDQAALGKRARRLPRNILAAIENLAACRRVETADYVEGSGLAGAVRPDETVDCAVVHVQVEAVDGDDAAKSSNEVADLEDGRLGSRRIQHHRKRARRGENAVHPSTFCAAYASSISDVTKEVLPGR